EAELQRNTPTVAGLAWHTWFYWDGRKDSLWAQSLAPIEAPAEMNSSRMYVARLVGQSPSYRAFYENLFGSYPGILLQPGKLDHASPIGDAKRQNNWYRIPAGQRQLVNRVFTNAGKALGAYVRTLEHGASNFDNYVEQLERGNYRKANKILDARSRQGLKLFIDDKKTQCLRCHNGPLFTNFEFHNIGSGNFDGDSLDFGRLLGLPSVLQDEFNCLGPYSDAPSTGCIHLKFINRQPDESLQGAYKTPALRDVAKTAPYLHDGRYTSLKDVLQHYNDIANTKKINAMSELNPIDLSDDELLALESFLLNLTGSQK
ncbi:MAG: cytochrome-c peroxidase, partial [Gammaproteobacteria bacterium]|nr:cytochrome-c peroxidase [Gammaproteobacteria bacterium]